MTIGNQDHSFYEIVEYLEEAADLHGTQVVWVENCDNIDPEAPQFCEKFIVDDAMHVVSFKIADRAVYGLKVHQVLKYKYKK